MIVRFSDVATAIAILIVTCSVLVFFAGLGALVLTSFGIIPAPF